MPDIPILGYMARVVPGLVAEAGPIVHAAAPAHMYAVITDDHVAANWLTPVRRSLQQVPGAQVVARAVEPGEARKTRQTWAALTDWMLDAGCRRDTTVVALGGGVVGDLAGFVAATFMRGVPVVQIPTSLLAMVDAAIGGKTGVDAPAGKNLVGAFHQPAAVLIDPLVLSTLPAAHMRAGLAEVIKHGAIADAAFFREAAAFGCRVHDAITRGTAPPWSTEDASALLARSVAIKGGIVSRDERESGERQILNAGHTVAHAVESASEYRILHGEAVAIGLVAESRIAEQGGWAEPGTARLLESALAGAGLPVQLPSELAVDVLVRAMRVDKKMRQGRIAFALLAAVGRPAGSDAGGWSTFVAEDDVRSVLAGMAAPDEPARPAKPAA